MKKRMVLTKNVSIEDLLNGRYGGDHEKFIFENFYNVWNLILAANGIKPSFSSEPIYGSLIENVERIIGMRNLGSI